MSKRVVIDDATLNLIKSSRAAPSVLLNRLITDMVERDYGGASKAFLKERKKLYDRIAKDIGKHPLVKMVRDSGGRIAVKLPERAASIDWSQKEPIEGHWKSIDTGSKKYSRPGLRRSIRMGLYTHGVAFGYLATAVHKLGNEESDTECVKMVFGQDKNPLRKGWYDGYYQPAWNCAQNTDKPNLSVSLSELLPVHGKAFQELLDKESAMVRKMVSDVCLLIEKGGKVRTLEALFKAMPAMLEHKDLKTLLGYHDNPQRERIEILTGLVTGETLLSA